MLRVKAWCTDDRGCAPPPRRGGVSPARPKSPRRGCAVPPQATVRASRAATARAQMTRGACLVLRRARLGKPCWGAAWRGLVTVTRARDPGAAPEG